MVEHREKTSLDVKERQHVVNDFTITVGTVNGSGSQTSNMTILRALFKMGIPVSGKNIFPSNIQGLPTWYTIRLSKDGFLARKDVHDIVVAMNPASFGQDLDKVAPGGVFFYADDIRWDINRNDIVVYPMPVKSLIKEAKTPSRLRNYVANMVYVGILAQVLGIELDKIFMALDYHFKSNENPVNLNFDMVKKAYDWAAENIEKKDKFYIEPMDKTEGYVLADANNAAALGAVFGGVQFVAWYPITPATSIAELLEKHLNEFRKDPIEQGKNTFAVIQAEDELAAIGMTIGAGWGGLRSMTSTSGPGLSLMAEYSGLAYYAEVPIVVWVVQRVGPSTGLPTRTGQGDLTFTYFLGHGDTNQLILLPGSVTECFEFGWRAFDIAEQLQAPVYILSDLDFGMNQWMTEPFEYPEEKMHRGKVLWEEDLEKLQGDWGRYRDVDGDGIPYRTVVGNRFPGSAYFARGTGHDENARYSEDPVVWVENMARLKQKYQTAKKYLPEPVLEVDNKSNVGVIAYGSTKPAIEEAAYLLSQDGFNIDFLRVRAIPFSDKVSEFIDGHERIYIIEMNRDGQMHQILTINYPNSAVKLKSIAYLDGLPLTAQFVKDTILAGEEK